MGAFALFKFVQSAGSAAAFLYSTKLNLHCQLMILAVVSTVATVCFCIIEWNSRRALESDLSGRRRRIDKTESQQSIIAREVEDSPGLGASPRFSAPSSRSGCNIIKNLLGSRETKSNQDRKQMMA